MTIQTLVTKWPQGRMSTSSITGNRNHNRHMHNKYQLLLVSVLILGCIACTPCIDAAYCYRCHNVVWSVWWSQDTFYKNGLTDRDAICRANSCGPKEPDGARSPTGRGNFGRLSGPLKSTGSLCGGVCSKRIIQSSKQCYSRQYQNALDWLVSHYIVSREKSAPCDAGFCQKFLTICLKIASTQFDNITIQN